MLFAVDAAYSPRSSIEGVSVSCPFLTGDCAADAPDEAIVGVTSGSLAAASPRVSVKWFDNSAEAETVSLSTTLEKNALSADANPKPN